MRRTFKKPSKPRTTSSARRSPPASTPALARGFKAKAERLAKTQRSALRLADRDRLDPLLLADQLSLPVVGLRGLRQSGLSSAALSHLTRARRTVFSGALCWDADGQFILINDSHAPTRQASDITHECAHALLGHEPREAFDGLGCRTWDKRQEAEADWLAGALLVPRGGALWALQRFRSMQPAAQHFGVSVALFRWRGNVTGVVRQLSS